MLLTVREDSIVKEGTESWVMYTRSSSTSVSRYLTEQGWSSLPPSKPVDIKSREICSSHRHPSVMSWEKAKTILERVKAQRIEIRRVRREAQWDDVSCVEEKVVNFITNNGRTFAFTGDPRDIPSVLELLAQDQEFKKTNLWIPERVTALLDPEATGYILAGLMAFLKGDKPLLRQDERGLPDITIYDDPTIEYSHVFFTFDDEGTRTRRKELIGNGQVVDYLGSLFSKYGSPGNGRGFYPVPDYYNAVLKTGDWQIQEMMEESKDFILVLGASEYHVLRNSIRIRPRKVVVPGAGEVFVREIAIPLPEMVTLDAVSRDSRLVYLDENHGALAPFIRLKVRPLLH
ncbi:putative Zn-dependent protease-like protein [Metallosphaera yellowstonensis MK1]|uniref:Putative Zn-dependent protease-like protein n=1 Tax=Metallosphaera yellowstonensis MK1 TaxID=671065 RepID=H2C7F5_9CREN|nr:metallopeptidase TldD-related protein [Metallosphaera yellowstonensis]EHP68081.1 putative Zn-dependent protease-like protein [Metallosphaera yellowstonensis MK1]